MTFEPPLYMQNSAAFEYSARQDRFVIDTLFGEGLLNRITMGAVTQRAAAANLSVDVAPFDCVIDGDDVARQGSYLVRLVEGENITVTAPPATGSRIDLVIVEVLDSDAIALAGRPEGPRLRVIAGTSTTGTPTTPTVPNTALPLASFTVAAGQTAILTANITDLRPQSSASSYQVTQGTQLEVMTSTTRDALTGTARFLGRTIYNSTTGQAEFWNGSAWAPLFNTAPIIRQDFAYGTDGSLATILDKDASGNTVKTTTFNYTSGNLSSIVETAGTRTLTTTFTYTSGNLTRIDRAVTVA